MKNSAIDNLRVWLKQICCQLSDWLNHLSVKQRKGLVVAVLCLITLFFVLNSWRAFHNLRRSYHQEADVYAQKWKQLSQMIDDSSDDLGRIAQPLTGADSVHNAWVKSVVNQLEE